jgi:hypothetical protein
MQHLDHSDFNEIKSIFKNVPDKIIIKAIDTFGNYDNLLKMAIRKK